MPQDNNIPLGVFQGPSPVENFLSSYGAAQQMQRQREQDARQKVIQGREDVQYGQQQNLQAIDQLGAVLDKIPDGDAGAFGQAVKFAVDNKLVDPNEAAKYTVNDLPRIRALSQQARALAKQRQDADLAGRKFNLDERVANANINQSNASADASRAQADYIRSGKGRQAQQLPRNWQDKETELLQNVQVAANNNADVSNVISQIDSGNLDPGLLKNNYEKAKTFFGSVDPADVNTRNYNLFISTMERLRNESLRLNKGVQTEGDAQRAWNELFTNINDKVVVRDQLARIAKLNERAARQNAGLIRSRRKQFFGKDYQEPDWQDLGVDPSLLETQQAPTTFTRGGAGVFSDTQAGKPIGGTPGGEDGWSIKRIR